MGPSPKSTAIQPKSTLGCLDSTPLPSHWEAVQPHPCSPSSLATPRFLITLFSLTATPVGLLSRLGHRAYTERTRETTSI
ncbi:hypothetical protein JAAARDRAFT_71249 [Jaapia argillacea MUCL 33604]|uniref:Uncharacterized protein n=1 Tax=Jaapia argillacea MUCL 33604 TaxID=933084 RepID=A0A067PYF6_9AGAM|nr:hypothetical protein JAAARDRAFT_71249 [Jaapia argillacea MUCL 33604]